MHLIYIGEGLVVGLCHQVLIFLKVTLIYFCGDGGHMCATAHMWRPEVPFSTMWV